MILLCLPLYVIMVMKLFATVSFGSKNESVTLACRYFSHEHEWFDAETVNEVAPQWKENSYTCQERSDNSVVVKLRFLRERGEEIMLWN